MFGLVCIRFKTKLVLILTCVCVCSSGGLLHWSQSSSETSPSLEVEISSYVLLASLSASSRSTSDLGYASRIVRWLVRQQNAYGGFSSTQVYFPNTSGLKWHPVH